MSNPNNSGTQIARVAADAKIFRNSDGSHNVKFNGYVDNNFRSRDNSYGSQRLPFESGYIKAETDVTRLLIAQAREGDMVSLATHLEEDTYPGKDGQTVYGLKVVVDDFWFIEPKSVRDARAAEKAAKRAGQAPVEQPAPQAQPQAAPVAQVAQPAAGVQGVPAWAQNQPVAQPVAVPTQAQQVAVPAQAAAVAAQGVLAEDPPF